MVYTATQKIATDIPCWRCAYRLAEQARPLPASHRTRNEEHSMKQTSIAAKAEMAVWYGLAALAALAIVVVASVAGAALLVWLLVVAAIAALPYLVGTATGYMRNRAAAARSALHTTSGETLAVQRLITTRNGQTRQAKVVPMQHMNGHELVLTVDGYMLVNEQGRVIHAIRPESAAE
jgi:hypothetical protein